jgi:hypothetical protein
LDIIAIGRSPFYFNLIPSVGSKADVTREWQLKSVNISGSPPSLRSSHRVENKEIRVDIDPRRIPRKMLEKPVTQQEEPDAWILSVSMPYSTCQNFV